MPKRAPKTSQTTVSGGHRLAQQLSVLGVRRVFTVPGETFLAALDGLYDQNKIQTIVCRHEGGAAMMAEADAKLTGVPGVIFVTRAPGLANAISGIVVARHDHTPLVVLVGLPNSRLENRGDLQLSEFENLMGAMTKWQTVVRDPDRLPATLVRAFHIARSGRGGPVAIGLPEDCLNSATSADVLEPLTALKSRPAPRQLTSVYEVLSGAKRPVCLVGGGRWSKKAQARLQQFAKRFDLPVITAFRCQDYIDNRHRCYAGHAGIAMQSGVRDALKHSDVILALGANLGDVTTDGYSLIGAPSPKQKLIHIHPSGDDISKVCHADIAIVASPAAFLKSAMSWPSPSLTAKRKNWLKDLNEAYKKSVKPESTPGNVKLEKIVRAVSKALPETSIVCNGAGNYAQFVHRYFVYKQFRTCLAPVSGSMGYGIPAAISAKLAEPNRPAVAFAGDGCFMMSCQELATAVQYGANIIVIIANNQMLGTIRMHQEQRFPDRVIATTLLNPDFVALAKSFDAEAEAVTKTKDFKPLLERALKCKKPFIIELRLDPDAITPTTTLKDISKTHRSN